MSRHESINQFKDGLMMDIHPIQTPNTVLTDCLNGTYITYNGNEHMLQNDMGNFKLEKCKLQENYIPIGTASYGDILYIASFNPIEKRFELGSYPSPLQWNSSDEEDVKSVSKILKRATDAASKNRLETAHFTYSELAELSWSSILDKEELKINPGDEYKIEYVKEASDIYIEEDEFFILDENNTKQQINDIELNKDFKPVSWQVPGYLGMTSSILAPYEHNLYIMSASTSPNLVSYKLRSVISIYDDRLLVKENLSNFFKNLKLDVDFFIEGNKIKSKSIEYSSEDGYPRGGSGGFNWHEDFEERAQYQWLYDKKQLVYEFGLDIPYVVTPSGKYTDDDLKQRSIGYIDENDYNFPLYKFIEPLDTNQEGYYEYYERPTEIRCVPVLRCDIPGNIDASYYGGYPYIEIEYDNLQSSVTYTANGADRNDVAASVFTWKYNEATNAGEKDTVTINADVFVSSEDVTMSAFFKPVDELLNSFVLPTKINTTTLRIDKDEYINFTNDNLTSGNLQFVLNDVEKYTYYVVFFLFSDKEKTFPKDLSELQDNNAKFIARFIYTGDKEDQDGRADRKLNLQKEVDEKLKSCYSNTVHLDLDWKDSSYSSTISDLLTTDSAKLSRSLFFNTDNDSGTLTQNIKSNSTPNVDKTDSSITVFGWKNVPITRSYCNTENGNYVNSLSSTEISIDIVHSINAKKKNEYYDFFDVTDITNLSNPTFVELDWATKNGKGRFILNGDWENSSTEYDLDKTYSHEGLVKAFNPTTYSKANQFKIIQLGAYRIKGAWSRIFSNSAKTPYLTAGDKGEGAKVSRTFLMARYGTGNSDPKFCLIQFPGFGGNDSADDFNNIVTQLLYFNFSSSPKDDEKFIKKWIWEYSISQANLDQNELNKKYTLYEKLNYSDNSFDKVYSWIYNGSLVEKLKCYHYCTFDNYSKIEKINFTGKDGETEKYAAKLLTTDITMGGVDPFITGKASYEKAWSEKTDSENESAHSNDTKYSKYLNATGVTRKNNMYCAPGSSNTVKTFAQYLTPSKDSDNYCATLSNNYPCTKKSNFYFGCTSSGNIKSIVGYIPAFLEWLP